MANQRCISNRTWRGKYPKNPVKPWNVSVRTPESQEKNNWNPSKDPVFTEQDQKQIRCAELTVHPPTTINNIPVKNTMRDLSIMIDKYGLRGFLSYDGKIIVTYHMYHHKYITFSLSGETWIIMTYCKNNPCHLASITRRHCTLMNNVDNLFYMLCLFLKTA